MKKLHWCDFVSKMRFCVFVVSAHPASLILIDLHSLIHGNTFSDMFFRKLCERAARNPRAATFATSASPRRLSATAKAYLRDTFLVSLVAASAYYAGFTSGKYKQKEQQPRQSSPDKRPDSAKTLDDRKTENRIHYFAQNYFFKKTPTGA